MELWKRNLVIVWLNCFITAVGMMSFLPLFPLYLRDLGLQDEASVRLWSGVLVAGAPLTATFMGPVWGALSDRLGRKLMLLRANLAIVVFVGAMSFVDSPGQLLGLRLAQGVFSGFIAPALTLVSVAAPADRQGRVAGTLHTAFLGGGIFGPLIGGMLADLIGMRWVFLVTASLSLLAGVLAALFVREVQDTRQVSAERLTPWLLLRTAARDVVTFASSGPIRAVLLAVFVVRIGHTLVDPILALYVETLGGYDPAFLGTVTGFLFGLFGVATILLSPVWGRVADRAGPQRLLLLCATGAGLAALPQAFVGSVEVLAVLRFLSGAFMAGVLPAAYAITASESPVERRGGAYGFTFSSLVLANAIGPASGGALAAALGIRPLIVVAASLILGAAAVMGLRSRRAARAAA